MQKLHQILTSRRSEILHTWTSGVRVLTAETPISTVELLDHVPRFLDELTESLASAEQGPPSPQERSSTAANHGVQRFRLGFDLDAVVREYGMLHRCVLDVAYRDEVAISREEHHVIVEAIYTGIADAVTQYTRQRDAELHRQAEEHFAFVAHELRNPLSSARLALGRLVSKGLLQPGPLSDLLARGLERMKTLIENTLSLSIASSGADLRLQPVRVSALLADAIEESNAAASDKAIRIQVEPLSEDIELNIDPRLMHSALTNIISNAVKFTHRGGVVTVRSRCEADGVRLDVQDGCGGLPDGASERMFAPFVQFGEDRTGYGLGLAIARQAVQAHGGSIRVHNHPGNGCTLSIELPIGCKRA